MARLRSWLRLLRVATATVWSVSLCFVGKLFLRPWPAMSARWRRRYFGGWARAMVKILKIDIEVIGAPPEPPFLLVSNHLSYIDIAVLGSQIDTIFVSKREVEDWPVVGTMVKLMDTIFVDRSLRRDIPRVIAQLEEALAAGEGVVIFPEGTSSGGDSVAPFRPSLLEPAAREGLQVSTAALSYSTESTDPPAHQAVCWWGDMTFPDHVFRMLGLPGFSARLAFGDEPIQDGDRKQLARRLESQVRDLFVPVVAPAGRAPVG